MSERAQNQLKQSSPASFTRISSGMLQRKCACGNHTMAGGDCEECSKKRQTLQRASLSPRGEATEGEVPFIVHDVLRSPGHPLDPATRAFMEPRFGHDFSQVRVHTDAKAAESARAVNARAYTVGCDVVFSTGQFAPTSTAGRKLIGHELTHVVQQQGASAGSMSNDLQIDSPGEASELEAAAASDKLASSESIAGPVASPARQQVSRQVDPRGERAPSFQESRRHLGSSLPYREATELAECIRIMGDANVDYCRETVLGEKSRQPTVLIERQGGDGQSFVSTDTITLIASVVGGSSGSAPSGSINWTVTGISANAGNGNPHSAANKTQFSFKPNPSHRPISGSRTPNDPIKFRVDTQVSGATGSFILIQDETDIIRQEYIDLGPTAPPARSSIVSPTIATYNTGNYSLIVDGGMDNALANTETEFQALTPAGAAAPAIAVSSGYRNPRRNVAAGSNFPVTSRHVWGTHST